MIVLRAARAADAPELARLHVEVWRATYRDLAPPAAVQALDGARRLAFWTRLLDGPEPPDSLILAERDGALAGFAFGGAATEEAFEGRAEIKNLYVGRAHARQGVGRRLLVALCRDLWARGAAGIGLGVVIGNDPAIAFYEAMGGRRHGGYRDPGPVWRSDNALYVWDDPRALPPG